MSIHSAEELNYILDKHKLWLNGDKGGERANLCCANLSHADLSGADLCCTNLRNVEIYCTRGDIVQLSGQGNEQRSVTLIKKTRMAFIGCFAGSFDEARAAIFKKYGDKAVDITGGYGLTLLAMDAIDGLIIAKKDE